MEETPISGGLIGSHEKLCNRFPSLRGTGALMTFAFPMFTPESRVMICRAVLERAVFEPEENITDKQND